MFTFGSLFAGIGGLDLGLERAGMTCRWQVEISPFCQSVLAKHWPGVPRYGDVRDVGKHNLEPVDLIAGGFPCQPHSVAGKRRGAADDRNLWPEFIRIIRENRPRYVLAENVSGIVTTYLDTVLSDLEGEAYTCWTFNIPACAFDAPHLRKRIFIVAHAYDHKPNEPQSEIWQADKRAKSGWPQLWTGRYGEDAAYPNGEQAVGATISRQKRNPRSTQSSLGMLADGLPPELAGRWLLEPPIGRIVTGVPGLDAKLRALGNAVVPQVAEWIGRQILATYKENMW